MLTFTRDGDGYLVHDKGSGRAVCRIQTTDLRTVVKDRIPGPGKVQVEEQFPLPRGQWLFHFCAGKRVESELKELLAGLPQEA